MTNVVPSEIAGTLPLPALVVDDDPQVRRYLADILEGEGFAVVAVADGQAALEYVNASTPGIVLLDLRMQDLDGMETLKRLKATGLQAPVIMLTGYGNIASAVEAIRLGAYNYLTKPLPATEIMVAIRQALRHRQLLAEIEELRRQLASSSVPGWLVGPSPESRIVAQQVMQVARSALTVLIEGETGTGKELVARAIHETSDRRKNPFIAVDCAAIPDTLIESELFGHEKGAFTGADRRRGGHFQLADCGTLFLDEIANLPVATQAKLLRVLQQREVQPLGGNVVVPVNVRIIAASNVPLQAEVRTGRFRPDLYYRLNEFIISLPPLRDRRGDVLPLANRFLAEASTEFGRPVRAISEAAAGLLLRHQWPGNVRELRNVIRRAVLLTSDVVRPEHLAGVYAESPLASLPAAPGAPPLGLSLKEIADMATQQAERQAIREALRATGGNKSETARRLKVDYKTLHIKMKQYGIPAREISS
jgi:DNA-binding NtrC family response regulator